MLEAGLRLVEAHASPTLHPIASEVTMELDEVKHRFPRTIGTHLCNALAESEPSLRFEALNDLAEELTRHLARLVCSEYLARNAKLASVEKALIKLVETDGRLAFGHLVSLVRLGLGSNGFQGPWTIGLLSALSGVKVPAACAEWNFTVKQAFVGLELCNSSSSVRRFIETQRNGTLPACGLVEFLDTLPNARNSKAHKGGRTLDAEWFRLLNERLAPALSAILSWEPLQSLLTDYEIVRSISRSAAAGVMWRTHVKRDLDQVEVPLDGGNLLPSIVPLEENAEYIAERSGRRLLATVAPCADLTALCRARLSSAVDEYRAEFLRELLDHGEVGLEARQRLSLLARDRELGAKVGAIEQECWNVLDRTVTGGMAPDPSVVIQLESWLGRSPAAETSERLEAFNARTEARVRAAIADNKAEGVYVAVVTEVARQLGLTPGRVETHLLHIGQDGSLYAPDGGGVQNRYYIVNPDEQFRRFSAILDRAKTDIQEGGQKAKAFWADDRTAEALRLINSLLPPHLKSNFEPFEPLWVGAGGDARPSLVVDQTPMTVETVARFFRELYAVLAERPERLEAAERSLPWTIGRLRRLAARRPEADGGRSAMTYPIACPEADPSVYFDAAASRDEVAYGVVQHLCDAGIPATLVVAPCKTWVDADSVAVGNVAGDDAPARALAVEVSVPGSSNAHIISADDQTQFAARWLKFMLDKALLPYRELPIRLAKSQILLSLRPDHGRSDRPFERAVHYRGVYIDTAMSTGEMVEGVLSACKDLEIPARSLNSTGDPEDEEDEENEGHRAWYVNVGGRSWRDMRRHGFWQAGGGTRYRDAVLRLREGDDVYAYVSGRGYVGFGVVSGARATRLDEFVGFDLRALADCDIEDRTRTAIERSRELSDDLAEYAAAIHWEATRGEEEAVRMRGMFTTPLTACRLTHHATIDFVRARLTDGSTVAGAAAAGMQRESVARYGVWPERWGKPKVLSLPAGEFPISRWYEVLVRVAESLLADGVLAADAQPDGTGRTVISQGDATGMQKPSPLSNGWLIETNLSATDSVKIAGGLLKAAGRDPASFSVRYVVSRGGGLPEVVATDATEEPA